MAKVAFRPLEFRNRIRHLAIALASERGYPEILVEGPAGTGKSFGIGAILDGLLWEYAGFRLLLARQTRNSMSESVLATLENKVWHPRHPVLRSSARRQGRSKYTYPNGSEIVLIGLEDPRRALSTEFDAVWINECQETDEETWEVLMTRLRNGVYPRPFIIGDCNPDSEDHWMNQRASRSRPESTMPQMWRLLTRHEDNPVWDDDETGYLDRLSQLTGVRRARYFEGKWVSAEGLVWPSYQPGKHRATSFSVTDGGRIRGYVPDRSTWRATFGAVDWGFRNAGCFQLWATDREGICYRIAEIYHRERNAEWWANQIGAVSATFDPDWIVVDPADASAVNILRRHLHKLKIKSVVKGAQKDVKKGLNLVRDYFTADRLRLCRDALNVRDMIQFEFNQGNVQHHHVRRMLDEGGEMAIPNGHQKDLEFDRLPTRTEDELTGYTFKARKPGQQTRDEPDPLCQDHGCDTLRYFVEEHYDRVLQLSRKQAKRPAGAKSGDPMFY